MELALLLVLHMREVRLEITQFFFAKKLFGNVKTFTISTHTWSTATSDLSFKALPPYRYG